MVKERMAKIAKRRTPIIFGMVEQLSVFSETFGFFLLVFLDFLVLVRLFAHIERLIVCGIKKKIDQICKTD